MPTRPKVLVVEDDQDVLELVGVALRRGGFAPVLVGSGCAAGAALAAVRPDAIVVGLPMGRGQPLELLRRWRRQAGRVPLVVLAAECGGSGGAPRGQWMVTQLPKPFSPRALADCLRRQVPIPAPA
jgi:DNA-binding response OmpR family regulator